MSVLAGSQPPTRTDSHGHCPRNTLTSTNLKAGTAPGSAAHRKGHGTAHRKAPQGTMPAGPRRSSTICPGCRPAAGTSRHATPPPMPFPPSGTARQCSPPNPVLSCRAANTHQPRSGTSAILLMRGVQDSAVTGAGGRPAGRRAAEATAHDACSHRNDTHTTGHRPAMYSWCTGHLPFISLSPVRRRQPAISRAVEDAPLPVPAQLSAHSLLLDDDQGVAAGMSDPVPNWVICSPRVQCAGPAEMPGMARPLWRAKTTS